MVAAVLVLALMMPFLNNLSKNKEELDPTILENYITYQSNVNQYDLINALGKEDINKIKISMAIEDKTIEDVLSVNSNLENLILE